VLLVNWHSHVAGGNGQLAIVSTPPCLGDKLRLGHGRTGLEKGRKPWLFSALVPFFVR